MFSVLVIVLFGVGAGQLLGVNDCGDEFRCDDGKQCIDRRLWCNRVADCFDNSDERFCSGTYRCLEEYFQCNNGMCIPISGLCDNVLDCLRGEDEESSLCAGAGVQKPVSVPNYSISGTENVYVSNETIRQAVVEAVKFLLSERRTDHGWGNGAATSRAIVALKFAEKIDKLYNNELMKEYLNIQLSLDLMPSAKEISLSHLALYINALYATCQNPRNFQGLDLVKQLRERTNSAMQSNFSVPLVLLTLCLSSAIGPHDVSKLDEMFQAPADRMGSKALVVMAMQCIQRKRNYGYFEGQFQRFIRSVRSLEASESDVYTKALIMQASNALGQNSQTFRLLEHQSQTGSFGDLLATYYAIPALLNTSLLALKCDHMDEESDMQGILYSALDSQEPAAVKYSLWITTGNDANVHSMIITYYGNRTFHDLMKIAASRDDAYRFRYDKTADGFKVYALADIPNDAQTGMSWTLYWTDSEKFTINSEKDLHKLEQGVDKIFPYSMRNGHFIFWLKRS